MLATTPATGPLTVYAMRSDDVRRRREEKRSVLVVASVMFWIATAHSAQPAAFDATSIEKRRVSTAAGVASPEASNASTGSELTTRIPLAIVVTVSMTWGNDELVGVSDADGVVV